MRAPKLSLLFVLLLLSLRVVAQSNNVVYVTVQEFSMVTKAISPSILIAYPDSTFRRVELIPSFQDFRNPETNAIRIAQELNKLIQDGYEIQATSFFQKDDLTRTNYVFVRKKQK